MLLPAAGFYVRRIALDATADIAGQVELAIEAGAPFTLEQLYYGFISAPDRGSALIFATHRRIFTGDSWIEAKVVIPAFLALLGESSEAGRLRIWREDQNLVAAAWDDQGFLPALVLVQPYEPGGETSARVALTAEIARRLPPRKWNLEEFAGPVEVKGSAKGRGLELHLKAHPAGPALVTVLDPVGLETMDVRDKAVLAVRKHGQRRDRLLWRCFAAAMIGLALAVVGEGGLRIAGYMLRKQSAAQTKLAEQVTKIETAQSLSARIEEMAKRQFRPLEMLAALNASRPASIQFTRCVSTGVNTLEIEAQTGNAGSVGTFETALHGLAVLESMEIRDVRLREGNTTFQLTAVFKPGAMAEPPAGGDRP